VRVGFIGVGNMGKAMIARLGVVVVAQSDGEDNQGVVDKSDIVFLTIKPQEYEAVTRGLSNVEGKIFVTVAPGLSTEKVGSWLGGKAGVIRTMPNTPSMVGAGVTAMCRGENIDDKVFDFVKGMLEQLGMVVCVDEDKMGVAVALSGSSPVLAYKMIEAMIEFAVQHGIDERDAREISTRTIMGACKMVLLGEDTPDVLTQRVCSKGGTTEKMVQSLDDDNFAEVVKKSMQAALDRAIEMRGS